MRIGTFAKQYDVKIDTIRYYMDIGLLIPKKKKHYYEFDQDCEEDMELILELKKYRFSLQEISNIISFKRVTMLTEKEDMNFFIKTLQEKKEKLSELQRDISLSIRAIDEKVESLHRKQLEASTAKGIPLDFIEYFNCPVCDEPLFIQDAMIKRHQVYEGKLMCACGYEASIQEGIVVTKHVSEASFNKHYLYDFEMFKIMDPSLISLSEKGSIWIREKLLSTNLENKVIIETNVDTYVFLHKYIEDIDSLAICIFCGSTIEMLKDLKVKIEKFNPNLKVLYILNSGLDLPLKKASIDFIIDSYSFNEYSLFHNKLPMERLRSYVKPEANLIGCSFYYQNNAQSLKEMVHLYPEAYRGNFTSDFIEENIRISDFEQKTTEVIGHTHNPGSYFKYHVQGEKATFFVYEAHKKN